MEPHFYSVAYEPHSVAECEKEVARGALFTASRKLKAKEQWLTFYAVPEDALTV